MHGNGNSLTLRIRTMASHYFVHEWRNLFKVGGTNARQKTIENFFVVWIGKCDVTSIEIWRHYLCTIWKSKLQYTILSKITPLWKRIDEPPEIQIGCWRGDPGQQRHWSSSYDKSPSCWLNKTVRRLRHWNFHLLSFWLALPLLCAICYVTINEKFTW